MKTLKTIRETEVEFQNLQDNLQALDGNSSQEEKAILLDGMKIVSSSMKELTQEIQSRRSFLDIFREAVLREFLFTRILLLELFFLEKLFGFFRTIEFNLMNF